MAEGVWEHIDLTWQNPTDDDFDRVMIRFSTTHHPLNIEDGTKIYEGVGESYKHEGLTEGKRYYYSGFTVDKSGNWSDAAETSCVLEDGGQTWEDDTGTSRVSGFAATPEHSKIILTWFNPNIADFERVVIRRSTTDYPSTPTAGTSIYDGTGERTEDSNVINGKKYYYSAFVKNTAGKWSDPAFASATPGMETVKGELETIAREVLDTIEIRDTFYAWQKAKEYTDDYTYTKKLIFRFKKKCSSGWLRFKHRWDIRTSALPKHYSSQKHISGEKDDLALSSEHDCGDIATVRLTYMSLLSSAVSIWVEYKLRYTGGMIIKIEIQNSLSLMG